MGAYLQEASRNSRGCSCPSGGREEEQEGEDDEDDGKEGNNSDSPYKEGEEGEEEEEEGQGHVGTYESTPDWVQFNSND